MLRELVSLLLSHGVTRCVLCPGSRNSPLINALSTMGEAMECRSATDERSAGFLALGWAAQARAAVAVVVTSGSAGYNLHPAVAEAHYRQVPLLVISADRPAAWVGQQDGQTCVQQGMFGDLVACSFSLPEGEDALSLWQGNRLINEALLSLKHRGAGPAHLNIPLREPLWKDGGEPLAQARHIERTEFATMAVEQQDALISRIRKLPRRMILLGQSSLPPQLYEELHDKGFVLLGEHLSNAHQHLAAIAQAELILAPEAGAEWSPDLLITVGGHVVSQRVKKFLRAHPPKEHWHLSADGAIIDTFCCLSHALEGSAEELWDLLVNFLPDMEAGDETANFHGLWYQADGRLQRPPVRDFPFCGLRMVGELINAISVPCTLHLANSLSLRLAQLFDLPSDVQVECNRGINGIEGSLSTAIGYALGEPERLNLLIIGDLSFFYDLNALGFYQLPSNLRILLINNEAGAIFKTIAQRPALEESEPYVLATHQLTAEAWATSCGLRYYAIRDEETWTQLHPELFAQQSDSPILLEAFTDSEEDAAAFIQFLKQSHHQSS